MIYNPGRLLVGAPRANSSTFENGIKEPGAVFRCSLQDRGRCEELKMDPDYGTVKCYITFCTKVYVNRIILDFEFRLIYLLVFL